MWTGSGEGGEGVDCEWGRRGGCGLGVGKEGSVDWEWGRRGGCGLGVGKEGRVWTVSGEGEEGVYCEWGSMGGCGL